MSRKSSKLAALGGALAILATPLSIPVAVQAGNWWAGAERSGSCTMAAYDGCVFPRNSNAYQTVGGARQIGGFYVNPTNNVNYTGKIPLEYRVNGGQWLRTEITMNATSGNYIDFGNGVKNFNFRFPRPSGAVGDKKAIIYFKFNYDLDR